MKKIIILILSMVMLISCISDMSELRGPLGRKGQADYWAEFGVKEILERRKVKQQIGGYSISMPENMEFKYGSTSEGTDKLFGKKRKYLYDNISKTGMQIYLIEEPIEKLKEDSSNGISTVYKKTRKNGRYQMVARAYSSRGGVLIEIKPGLYLTCIAKEIDAYVSVEPCEAIVKVMKGE